MCMKLFTKCILHKTCFEFPTKNDAYYSVYLNIQFQKKTYAVTLLQFILEEVQSLENSDEYT